jgi:ATP-binding cassette subfamily C (CFTR/MRP) protein 1
MLTYTANMSFYITPFITFGVFILIAKYLTHQTFTVATAFTSLSIITLLSNPLAAMFSTWSRLAGAIACFDRIQKYLQSDMRSVNQKTGLSGVSNNTREDSSRLWVQNGAGVELCVFPTVQPTATGSSGRNLVMRLENATFSLSQEGPAIIHDINLEICKGSVTMIIGKVGSGKSILLKSILGELPQTLGVMQCDLTDAAYCEQDAWLINDTIQNNIIGESSLNARWYETVINACALDIDFEQLQMGDLSLIGSKGLTLSGGQKQRVVS